MELQLNDFESGIVLVEENESVVNSDNEINEKYEKGEARIVTEQGAIKLPLITGVFDGPNYELMPVYQRRITWNTEKRSKLIESFIINIPVPPIFVYEVDFGKYEVMDGLQRISAIKDFYNDKYALEGLTEWSELNGLKYSQLPQKIKEGIDRRQVSIITLLKESAKSLVQEQKMKRMVFERLNTGGVKLEPQEIRNALYDGEFNKLCKRLSENSMFRKMWGIPTYGVKLDGELSTPDEEVDIAQEIVKNKMYMRMYDVELVLRFFAMRHIDEFSKLSEFLDAYLIFGNKRIEENPDYQEGFENLFNTEMKKAYELFGEKAFCLYALSRGKEKWSAPNKMIYDPLMLALSNFTVDANECNVEKNVSALEMKYRNADSDLFDGKHQSKADINRRKEFFEEILADMQGVQGNE